MKAADITRATDIAIDLNAAAAEIEHAVYRLAALSDRCERMPALFRRVDRLRGGRRVRCLPGMPKE